MLHPHLVKRLQHFRIPDDLKAQGIYPYFKPIEANYGTEVMIGGKKVLMFGSNSYMGLSNHPKIIAASHKAIRQFGSSCSGSRFLNGTTTLHNELEERLAEHTGKEACLVFSTGYQTNLGIVATLTGRNEYIFLDELNHASIIEGSRLSFSRIVKFEHNNMESLEKELEKVPYDAVKLIVVDGIFSMEGDVARLPEIVRLANSYQAMVMVDDAHAFGVIGDNGAGTASHFRLEDHVDLIMSTFSKSLASLGGFVAANADVINYLKHHARSLIFSASIPPSVAASALAALDVMQNEPWRLAQLWENTFYMRKLLNESGYDTGVSETPIIPIYLRDDQLTFRFTSMLLNEGVFVNPVVSPAVKSNCSMIRISLMATHTKEQIEIVVEKIDKVARMLEPSLQKQRA